MPGAGRGSKERNREGAPGRPAPRLPGASRARVIEGGNRGAPTSTSPDNRDPKISTTPGLAAWVRAQQ
jgi:hypothetical protein